MTQSNLFVFISPLNTIPQQPALARSRMAALSTECDLCARDGGHYDFGRVCCRARFIVSLPLKRLRSGWMERWQSQLPYPVYAEVRDAVEARWVRLKGPIRK